MNADDEPAIAGLRILVLEDEALLSLLLEDTLTDLGCRVAGTFQTLAEAQAFLAESTAPLDLAILDVNIGGEWAYPVATLLAARGIPLLFVTGYDESDIDAIWRATPRISKPFNVEDLGEAIARAAGKRAAGGESDPGAG